MVKFKTIKITITKTTFFTVVVFLFISMFGKEIVSQTKIFYEDCEDTNFSHDYETCNDENPTPEDPWFLERSMGTSNCGYWSELTNELTRSTNTPYAGSYCMTYDPWTTGNPHSNVGYNVNYGNTSNFSWTNVHTSTYYFKWYQRWETGIDYSNSVENKTLYLGYSEWGGDFTFTLKKCGRANYHITIRSNPGYNISYNSWKSFSGGNLDNMEWHKIEVYLDLGTTGATGSFYVKIDGVYLADEDYVTFRNQMNINNGVALGIVQWPSNISGTPVGTAVTWLDNLEIWNGLPNQTDISHPSFSNPNNFTLQQNYPNPFNHSATIKYSVTKPCNVQIKIFNQLGQEVCTLINEHKPAGNHFVTWDGKDNSGKQVSSGIYFYNINIDGKYSETRSMLMIK